MARPRKKDKDKNRMPRIAGEIWFNSEKLEPEDFKGKVVLVDFWTHTCVNCLRTLPYLRSWWARYKDRDFILLGIYTPEFDFEKAPKVVARAVQDLEIDWPVVLDNERINWANFANRRRPALYLANGEGNIVYHHFGEGDYKRTEDSIRALLGLGAAVDSPSMLQMEEHIHGGACFRPTPQLYCGYGKGSIANPGGYINDGEADYLLPERLGTDSIALSGRFTASRQYVESAEGGAAIHLSFQATEVNLVLLPAPERATTAIQFNGAPLSGELRGNDVNEESTLVIDKPAMYNLLKSDEPIDGTLTITARQNDFRAYVFTFSGCVD
jgi:thiol-disulfide isomerase/thioredoxin